MQENDGGLAIDFGRRQPPCDAHARIDAEVTAVGEAAGVSIGNEQTSVRTDQFAESIPILAIEPFDVQAKDLCVLEC